MINPVYHSPRTRRLRNDLAALDRLRSESSVFRFGAQGDPPYQYSILFQGRGLWRDRGKIRLSEAHRVEVKLGASYPRSMPEIRWVTPIYHPNISEIGMVCLGGYGTNWVPSVQLDELCVMLWDMARYHNYDIRSPYNRDAALWVASQTAFLFPVDPRPLRDLRAARGRAQSALDQSPDGDLARPKRARNGSRRHARGRAELEPWTPLARVRRLMERYGQVFGNEQASAAPDQQAPPPPSHPELEALASAELDATTASPPAAPAEELVILETCIPEAPASEPAPAAGDEIIFIE
jgi:ubiquitin-protein ligase